MQIFLTRVTSFLSLPLFSAGFLTPLSMFTFVVLIITIVVCLSHVCFGHFKYLSAHNYKVRVAVLKVRADWSRMCSSGRLSWDQSWNPQHKISLSLFQIDTKDTKGTKDTEADKVENGRPARSSPSNRSQVKSSTECFHLHSLLKQLQYTSISTEDQHK